MPTMLRARKFLFLTFSVPLLSSALNSYGLSSLMDTLFSTEISISTSELSRYRVICPILGEMRDSSFYLLVMILAFSLKPMDYLSSAFILCTLPKRDPALVAETFSTSETSVRLIRGGGMPSNGPTWLTCTAEGPGDRTECWVSFAWGCASENGFFS